MDATKIIEITTIVVTAAAAVAALFPRPAEGSRLSALFKIIDFLALNFGNAKNAKRGW